MEEKQENTVNNKISLKISKKLIAIALIAIVVIIGIIKLNTPASPQKVAESFMSAMKSSNYEKAYTYLDITETGILTKEKFVESMKNIEKEYGKVKDYRIDFRDSEREAETKLAAAIRDSEYLESNRQDYHVVMGRNDRSEFGLTMKNISTGKKADWKISPKTFYEQFSIHLPNDKPDIKIAVNGINLNLGNKNVVSFTTFKGATDTVSIEGNDIKTITIKLPKESDKLSNFKFEANKDVQSKFKNIVDGFNKADIMASKDYDISHYAPFVKKEIGNTFSYSIWEKIEEKIKSIRDDEMKMDYQLVNVEYSDAELTGKNTAEMIVKETWKSKTMYSDGRIEDNPQSDITWKYIFEKQNNGDWLLTQNIKQY